MKNIRTYLTTAVISLMLVAVSACMLSTVGESARQTAICVPLLFGLIFCWSAVKATLILLDEDLHIKSLVPAPVSRPVWQVRFA